MRIELFTRWLNVRGAELIPSAFPWKSEFSRHPNTACVSTRFLIAKGNAQVLFGDYFIDGIYMER